MQPRHPTATKGGILILEPQTASLQIARYAREQGYAPIIVTADRADIEAVREPYRECLAAISDWHAVDYWRPDSTFRAMMAELVSRHAIVGVHARSELCLPAEAEIRKLLGLPYASGDAIESWTDKLRLRRMLRQAGLSRLSCAETTSVLEAEEWTFPGEAMFKPRRGVDSLGVQRCRTRSDVADALCNYDKVLRAPITDTVDRHYLREFESGTFVEEAARGELLSVEGIVESGRLHTIGITGRNLYSRNRTIELGFRFPYNPPCASAILEKAEAILGVIGYHQGAVHMEMMVDGLDSIELIDFNPRLVGSDVMLAMNRVFDTRMEEYMLRLATGEEVALDLAEPRCFVDSRSFFAEDSLEELHSIEFPEHPQLIHGLARKPPGARLDQPPKHVASILGSYTVWGRSAEEADAVADWISSRIRVNEVFGIDQ
jgi:biotin carboxylase